VARTGGAHQLWSLRWRPNDATRRSGLAALGTSFLSERFLPRVAPRVLRPTLRLRGSMEVRHLSPGESRLPGPPRGTDRPSPLNAREAANCAGPPPGRRPRPGSAALQPPKAARGHQSLSGLTVREVEASSARTIGTRYRPPSASAGVQHALGAAFGCKHQVIPACCEAECSSSANR
jgi:hypothetical protein